jgi:lambda repressor-like predicted transcriptional regulator
MTSYFAAEPARRMLRRLAAESDSSICALADNMKVDRSTIQRLFTRDRLRWDAADHIAVALGCHPCQVWPEWFDYSEVAA